MWSIENGVLKSPGLLEEWGADLVTEKEYRDYVLMVDFWMPTISDSGINFRRLIPEIPGFGDAEQFNLRSRGGMGHLESYFFREAKVLPEAIRQLRQCFPDKDIQLWFQDEARIGQEQRAATIGFFKIIVVGCHFD